MKALRQAISKRLNLPVKMAVHNLLTEIKIARASRNSEQIFQSLRTRKNLKVHLGCGPDVRKGWVNIDLALNGYVPKLEPDAETIFINHDMRLGLPLADNSCELIYSSHFLEHLDYKDGIKLMRDCYRVLQPGGVLRLCLPDFRRSFEAYLQNDHKHFEMVNILELMPEIEPGTETLLDYVNYAVYQHGEHKCVYDQEKVRLILESIGFSRVIPSDYKPGLDPDSQLRRQFSFYAEAIK